MITEQEFKNHISNRTLTIDICKEWIDSGSDINIKDNNGWTALILASYFEQLKIVQLLVKNGAKLDIQNNDGWTALMYASYFGNLEIVQYLVENGAKIDIQYKYGRTALIWVSYQGHLEIVQYLVEKDAKIDIKNNDGKTALYYQRKNIKIIKLFLQSKQYSTKIKGLKRKNISFNLILA